MVRFDISKSLVILTWRPKETPPFLSDIFFWYYRHPGDICSSTKYENRQITWFLLLIFTMFSSCCYKALITNLFFVSMPIVTAERDLFSNRCQRWSQRRWKTDEWMGAIRQICKELPVAQTHHGRRESCQHGHTLRMSLGDEALSVVAEHWCATAAHTPAADTVGISIRAVSQTRTHLRNPLTQLRCQLMHATSS